MNPILVRVSLPLCLLAAGCASTPDHEWPDSIIVAGVPFHTGAPVITWMHPAGYNAYLERCHFEQGRVLPSSPARGCNTPRRYSRRSLQGLADETRGRVETQGFDLQSLGERVDQFVLHYDVCGTSRRCFEVLHDMRGLSVHFLLDLDGTIYQTMDLIERGRHATIANDRSVGIEIANIGAYPDLETLWRWYVPEPSGGVRVQLPGSLGDGHQRVPGHVARPMRPGLFEGVINGRRLLQYDYTPEQHRSLALLLAALNRALPRIRLEVPRDGEGRVVPGKLERPALEAFSGILGHYHVQTNKVDPGPALDWEALLEAAREARGAAGAGPDRGSGSL